MTRTVFSRLVPLRRLTWLSTVLQCSDLLTRFLLEMSHSQFHVLMSINWQSTFSFWFDFLILHWINWIHWIVIFLEVHCTKIINHCFAFPHPLFILLIKAVICEIVKFWKMGLWNKIICFSPFFFLNHTPLNCSEAFKVLKCSSVPFNRMDWTDPVLCALHETQQWQEPWRRL